MTNSANETLKGTRPPVNWRNFATCLFIAFGLGVFSYMNGIIGSTLTKPSFLLYMNLFDDQGKPTPGSTQRIGATTGVFQVGLRAKSSSLSALTNEVIRLAGSLGSYSPAGYWTSLAAGELCFTSPSLHASAKRSWQHLKTLECSLPFVF